ncbi:hypothetical protein [Clostridium thermarum]|uniref:hypothetical protein n=1 Tax=Clostridium thermarum TaxID=1716543 RepID=UPI00111CC233|nr:hypothetical protein [Clostridium thermarum]
MEDELLEIIVLTRKDSAGLPIPERIFINDGIEGPSQYQVERIIRRDNEIIKGEKTTMFTCLVKLENIKRTWDIRYYHDDDRWMLYRA